jgi:hypothetical protein
MNILGLNVLSRVLWICISEVGRPVASTLTFA